MKRPQLALTRKISADNHRTAIGFLLLGVAGGLGLDLAAKALLAHYSLTQFVFLRSLIGLTILIFAARQFGGFAALASRRWGWHLLRTAMATGAMFGFFYGLANMPLVNALTLGFTAPLMVTALSVPFLGDHVGWRRWAAVIAGFIGVLVILRPGANEPTLADAAVLVAAFCYATQAITARFLADTESTYALSFYVIVGPMLLSAAMLGSVQWTPPDLAGWGLFLVAGACSVIAWLGLVGGYRRAQPALLAPFEYTALVAGAIAGYLIWDEIPDRWVVVGGVIIIASGLFVVYRSNSPVSPDCEPVEDL
jgi:drug/metabolite transporter (DMT)-like permease